MVSPLTRRWANPASRVSGRRHSIIATRSTGQGLSIAAAGIVEKHGVIIAFEAETGRGTTFIIRLPAGHDG
ncbi:MAG: ATP-binding protein [Pseudomonadota bacterium]